MYLREYETIIIVDPDSGSDGIQKVLDRSRDALKKTKGQEVRYEDWGVRRLAYACKKHRRGNYLYLLYLGTEGTVAELERLLRITEASLKYQTVVLNDRVDPKQFDFDAARAARTIQMKSVEKPAEAAESADEPAPVATDEPAATDEKTEEKADA